MTRFDVIKAIYGVKEFSTHMYDFAVKAGSAEKLAEFLSGELTADELRMIEKAASKGAYPICLDDISGDDQLPEDQEAGHMEFIPIGNPRHACNALYKQMERQAREKSCFLRG